MQVGIVRDLRIREREHGDYNVHSDLESPVQSTRERLEGQAEVGHVPVAGREDKEDRADDRPGDGHKADCDCLDFGDRVVRYADRAGCPRRHGEAGRTLSCGAGANAG